MNISDNTTSYDENVKNIVINKDKKKRCST